MATYALTVSTNALGLGVISGATVVVERKRTTVTDIYPTSSLYIKKAATNASGIATIQLEADDGTVFHEVKIFNTTGVLVYKNTIQMPPQAADIDDLPLNDIITESAYQAVQAKDAAQTSATNAANSAAAAAISATNASNSASAASTSATNANNSANAASTSATNAATSATNANNAQLAAESARDAALIQAGVYTTEALGRAAVADGQAFKVQGSGDVAAYEYRRTNSTTSVLIATYPSVGAVWAIDSLKRNASIGKNRFNPTDRNVVAGSAINNATGATVVTAGFNATGYIPVAASTAYTMSVGRNYAWYDSARNYISGGTGTSLAQSVTSPANAAYFRCGISDATLSTFQFELGASSTSFAAYTEEPPLLQDVVTTSAMRRLSVTPERASFISAGKNKFDLSAVTVGQYITAAGP
jgi:hypothetical protein